MGSDGRLTPIPTEVSARLIENGVMATVMNASKVKSKTVSMAPINKKGKRLMMV